MRTEAEIRKHLKETKEYLEEHGDFKMYLENIEGYERGKKKVSSDLFCRLLIRNLEWVLNEKL